MEIKRDYYLNKLILRMGNRLIKIITGIRGCGKSYLLGIIFRDYLLSRGVKKDHIIKLDLRENEKYLKDPRGLYDFVLSKVLDNDTYYIILDEIQKVNDFESVLNSFLRKPNLDVYVTGSNSKFLSSDIITEFRGRGDEIRMYPLSFSEFMSVYKGSKMDALDEYIKYGGLPLTITFKTSKQKLEYLTSMANTYVMDIIERYNIRKDEELKILLEIISLGIGSLISPNKLYNTFLSKGYKGITNKTISVYLKYLEDSFLIERSRRFDVKGRKYIDTPSKYYFIDLGIRNILISFSELKKTHIMENIIYVELRRRGFNVDVGIIEKRNKLSNGKKGYMQLEIDFVANKGSDKYYIQSTYIIENREEKERKLRPLLSPGDHFKTIVIVYDNFIKWQDDNGIIYMSIYDFLLSDTSLEDA